MSARRVALLQIGARRNYIAARQLEAAGLLHSLICDVAWTPGGGGLLERALARSGRLKGKVARRTVHGIARERVHASFVTSLSRGLKGVLTLEHSYAITDDVLGRSVPRRTLEEVDVVVNYFGNGGTFLDRAKRAGKVVVTDFISHPRYWRTVEEERTRWPGLEADKHTEANRAYYERRVQRLVRISDFYLCPSQSVADGLREFTGFDESRVRVVPYGASGFMGGAGRPERFRILFAASVISLTKGVAYLAEAARAVRSRCPSARFIVAGFVSEEFKRAPQLEGLEFVGVLDKNAMAREFATADLFCLPSLAEGSATVIYEALANGLPIVTTRASGSVIRDGTEGRIVPERDAAALASAIVGIVEDRGERGRMSEEARLTAARYSDEHCGALFLDVVREALALRIERPPVQ